MVLNIVSEIRSCKTYSSSSSKINAKTMQLVGLVLSGDYNVKIDLLAKLDTSHVHHSRFYLASGNHRSTTVKPRYRIPSF